MITKTEILHQKGFYITGISVRTSNQNGQSQKDIANLWSRFINEDLIHQIKYKASDDIYCVYTDYESDHTGFYTAVLGCRVYTSDHTPDGFNGIVIPPAKYLVYYLNGKYPEKVAEAWQEIWQSDVNRGYKADYDLYSADAKSFEETEVKIYLTVN